MQQFYSSIGEAMGAANASNADMAARIAVERAKEEAPTTTIEHITARQVRKGDVFVLHGHERMAACATWPTALRGHVHITFVGGGGAVIPADRPLTVTRTVEAA